MTDNHTVLDLDAEIESYKSDSNDECMDDLSLLTQADPELSEPTVLTLLYLKLRQTNTVTYYRLSNSGVQITIT